MYSNLSKLWSVILAEISKEISKPSFETWFTSTHPVSLKDQCLVVAVPNDFTREWLHSKYRDIVIKKMKEITSQNYDLQFIVAPDFVEPDEIYKNTAGISTAVKTEEKVKKQVSLFNPVSYTHLDVYKRQGMAFKDSSDPKHTSPGGPVFFYSIVIILRTRRIKSTGRRL